MTSFTIRSVAVTTSTNDDIKRAGEADEVEGLVVWAKQQTSGRGRHGREWESPEGSLYCSVLLRPTTAMQFYGQYSFVASLALYDTVRDFLPQANITLKWPNDVLVDGKKISGILLEAGFNYLVVGMGLNVAHHPDAGLYPATSLHGAGAGEADTALALHRLLAHLSKWYGVMQKQGFTAIRSAWLEWAQKGPLTVRLPDGALEGTFLDIDEDGSLQLKLADGTERAIATGDVFFRPKE